MANTGRRAPLAAGNESPAPNDQTANDDLAETRMRAALGLGSGPTRHAAGHTPQQRPEQARARHRFVQDGGVPVVTLHKPEPETAALRERVAALEAQLEAERSAHAATRRTLAEQQAAHQAVQTRLRHNDLAHGEALETERRLRQAAETALEDARQTVARSARPVVKPSRPEPTAPKLTAAEPIAAEPAPPEGAPAPARRATKPAASPDTPPRKRGRPRINPIPEPKPVRWWTPSFKAKTKA